MTNKQFFLSLALVLLTGLLQDAVAQNHQAVERSLQWAAQPKQISTPLGPVEVWSFQGSGTDPKYGVLPIWSERFALQGRGDAKVVLTPITASPCSFSGKHEELIPSDYTVSYQVAQERAQYWLYVQVMPLRKQGGRVERLERFRLDINYEIKPIVATDRGGPNTFTSVLADGAVYKFGVSKTGMYKLDYAFLKNELKISNLDQIDPRNIRIYGNSGNILPQRVGNPRPDDLIENAVKVVGEADGKFDQSDYILMYGDGPVTFEYDLAGAGTQINGEVNIYSNENYYFLKIGSGNGLRIQERASIDSGGTALNEFDDVIRLEDEKVNLLDFYSQAQGSGQRWFGDYFKEARIKNYSDKFVFPNAVVGSTGKFSARFAGRSSAVTSVRLTVNDTELTRSIPDVKTSDNESQYAMDVDFHGSFAVNADQTKVQIEYLQGANSEGWLDYIELQVRRKLMKGTGALIFRALESKNYPVTEWNLSNANGVTVWDITNKQVPHEQKLNLSGTTARFGANTDQIIRTWIAFADADAMKPDVVIGKIPNQNIHAHQGYDLVIVYHPEFKKQAERLAEHRRSFSGLATVTVDILELYNEFAGGKKDPTAIRDYARMLLDRDARFKYLLLIGDGSFDPRGISDAPKQDFIPVFETPQSLQPILSYPADDYFALLSDDEGAELAGSLDISVGRLPVSTLADAEAVVEKIITYDQNPASLGDWHNRMLYFADDEDNGVHLFQAEDLERMTASRLDYINSDKIYLDAYQQVATSGGQFYPEAKKAFNANFFKGNLIVTYIGHGGPRGWTQERTIDNNDISLWGNDHRCPLIISATCSFGGYDNPRFLAGGELALLKAKGGAIGLFTTVRAVYILGNDRLTDAVESVIFTKKNGRYRSIGEVLSDAKNLLTSSDQDNARRFTLLGDPAQILALPEYRVVTTTINGRPYNPAQPDTIAALEQVSLAGEVRDTMDHLLAGFNGRVFVTVFDKPQTLQTLGQDPGSPKVSFKVQRNILFKGSATVTNGKFNLSFITPKDINYAPGKGKISYYAENGTPLDAAGADGGIVIAGISDQIKDDKPPVVQVFMNDDKFVTGGITDANPRIFAKISDDYGINVTGTAIGHDLTGVVDGNVQATIVLNDFYQSDRDNARAGTVVYPLNNIAPGVHKVVVEAWDVANNHGKGFTEFVVAESAEAALNRVLNYPNPFTTHTSFQFEHNMFGQLLDIQVRIFSVSGKLVKTIQHQENAQGYRVTNVVWDGRDDFGDRIGKGIYVYKVSVRGTDLAGNSRLVESDFEKLVILK